MNLSLYCELASRTQDKIYVCNVVVLRPFPNVKCEIDIRTRKSFEYQFGFGIMLDPFLDPFWYNFGIILDPFWYHFGSILISFWINFDIILD